MIPRSQYTSNEIQREIVEWEEINTSFTHTFIFFDENLIIDAPLQVIETNIFEDIPVMTSSFPHNSVTVYNWMECYNITGELDDDDLHDIRIPKYEGS